MPKSKSKRRSKSKTGFFGVRKKLSGKYEATVWIDGKIKNLGSSYDTAKQAAKAHDKEAIQLRKPFSTLNFPKKAPVGYTPIQQALYSHNTVGYRGVYKNGKNFIARIKIKIQRHLGTFETPKEAAIVYDRAVLKANKSTTLLNFPDMVHNLDVEPKRKKLKVASNNSTGYRGVYKSGGKFTAMATINGKLKYFGSFNTAVAAALAYDQAVIKKGNKKSTLNFPEGEKKQEKQKKQKIKKMKKMKKMKKKQKITKKKELLTIQEYNEMLQASK